MPKFEELLAELEERGMDAEDVGRLKEAFEATPLRQELKQTKAEAQAAMERATKAEQAALRSSFEKLGIKAKPEALAIPDTVDRLDHDAVQAWAVEVGLAEPSKPDVPAEELDALDRIAESGVGASGAVTPSDRLLSAPSEEEFWAEAERAGVTH